MIGLLVNTLTIVFGSAIGLLIKNNLNKKLTDAIMLGIGLFTIYLGITSLSAGVNSVVFLLALIIGGIIGTALNIEDNVNALAAKVQNKMSKGDGDSKFAQGFVGFFTMSCVGAYTIVASFNAGFGDNTMLYTKSAMDFIVSMAMASSLGIGVLFAGIPILLYELILVCFSGFLSSFLSEPMIEALSCMGAILTVGIGTNISKMSQFKIVNYIPSLLLAPLFAYLFELIF